MDLFGLLAVAITTCLFVGAALDAASLYVSARPMSVGERIIGCFGWLVATFGPMILAILFWRRAKGLRNGWTLHLLMLPLAFATLKIGASLMLSVIGSPDFDDTLGGPIIQAMVLFLLAVIGYYSAVLHAALNHRSKASKDS